MKSRELQHRWPNLFLIGAPKCGTTAMSHYLAGHPRIFMSEQAGVKEPWYFNTDISMPGAIRETSDYLALFKNAAIDLPYWGEASPLYLYSEVAISNIYKIIPDARFIIMVRNPLELVHSLYRHHSKVHGENAIDLKDAWRVQELRLTGEYPLPPGIDEAKIYQYGSIAKVGAQIERTWRLIEQARMHIVIYDDFEQNPKLEYLKILEFLALEDDGRMDFPVLNGGVSYRYPSLHSLLRRLAFLRKRLHIPGGWGINAKIDQYNVIQKKQALSLSPELRNQLVTYFKADVNLLSELLNRDLTYWLD